METKSFPLLPLRDTVVFPGETLLLYFGRKKSIKAIDYAIEENIPVILITQHDPKIENPEYENLFKYGVIADIDKVFNLTDGSVKVNFKSKKKVKLIKLQDGEFLKGIVQEVEEPYFIEGKEKEIEALLRSITENFQYLAKLNSDIDVEEVINIISLNNPLEICYKIVSRLKSKTEDKVKVLVTDNLIEKLNLTYSLLLAEIEIQEIEERIKKNIKERYLKSQKEYYLNQKLNAIQSELGKKEEEESDTAILEKKLKELKLTKEAREKVEEDLRRLKMMHPMSAEAAVIRTYLEWIVDLPWEVFTEDEKDIKKVEDILNEDHYGLEKVKERILEYIAVRYLSGSNNSPILCFVGPPGVGKTSLGKSIARALNRNFVRISLGGVRDEAEIRGHRRTYIGALPGKIIQGMKKAKSSNPVFLLDEIDKINSDFRGDPASALLEVLDPEQNKNFNDHYIGIDYDLSNVFFITTANTTHTIPKPLLDRMEVIFLDGYTDFEKKEIAKSYLIPEISKITGIKDRVNVTISDNAIFKIVREYTREAGVRNLKREIEKIYRKIAKSYIKDNSLKDVRITEKNIQKYLGVPKFKESSFLNENRVGITNGLAWTEAGGDVLQVEVVIMNGNGNLDITGKLGEVMKESVKAAVSYVRMKSDVLNLVEDFYKKIDIHVHVPEGAIPKDGPSAGITIATSLVSSLTNIPVRKEIAMTGEITLSGYVLPVGGLKQKLLAAKRSGIKEVIIPEKNLKDLEEIPENIKEDIKIIPVKTVDEVLINALVLSEPMKDYFKKELLKSFTPKIFRKIQKENFFINQKRH